MIDDDWTGDDLLLFIFIFYHRSSFWETSFIDI